MQEERMRMPAEQGDPGQFSESETSFDLLGFIRRHLRSFVVITVAVTFLTGAGLVLAQSLPARGRVATMNLTLTFPGVQDGRYPNRAPFSPQDVVAMSVVEPIWRAKGLEGRVALPDILRNLQVRSGGTEAELLLSEFQQKLSNSKLTAAERTELETELSARMKALTTGTLVLSLDVPAGTTALSDAEAVAFLASLPAEWARASDAAGARAYDFPLPNGRELVASADRVAASGAAGDVVMHAERMKEFMDSLATTIGEMSKLPGSDAVRDSRGASIVDLGQEVNSIRRNLVIPLYIDTLRQAKAKDPRGYAAIRDTRRKLLESERTAAAERAKVIRNAFEDYSSETSMVRSPSRPGANDPEQSGILANVDGTFIDRVIEQAVKSRDVEFRRELTDRRLQAELDVVEQTTRLEFETWLEETVGEQSGAGGEPSGSSRMRELSGMLAAFADRTREIMDVLAARNLNSASTMFQVDVDPFVRAERPVSTRTVLLLGLGLWLAACATVTVAAALRDRRPGGPLSLPVA